MRRFRKLFLLTAAALLPTAGTFAQGWPANYNGVMLQGFYWNSYNDTKWSTLEKQADELCQYFSLIWVPQSGKCLESNRVMGYTPYYYFNQNSSFGTEAELRSMIKTFKSKGLGTIADVVINHHNTNGWFSFPAETYGDTTYQLQSTDITADDDGGATATEAAKEGVSLSANKDEGEDWSGMRDLDHQSANVQRIIKAYVKFLKDDLGYTGFRYDMVKGFSGTHVADYNDAAGVDYSVGECWDSNSNIEKWITTTGKKSAAFDFQFRYNVRDAINNNDWSRLNSTNNLIHDAAYRQYAVTFVENHDMQDRGTTSGYTPDPILRDTLAANAYLLAMPGTPCVFLTHWQAYKQELKSMIDARRTAGITNQSTYSLYRSNKNYYANIVTGQDGTRQLLVAVGSGMAEPVSTRWVKILSGYHYAYYLNPACETAWADKASGTYTAPFDVTLTAVTATEGARLVYTLDGSTPTAASATAASGTTLHISEGCTLTVGLLKGSAVSGIVSRTYTIGSDEPSEETFDRPAEGYTLHAFFLAPASWTETVQCWAWNASTNFTGGTWPGQDCYRIGRAEDGRYIWEWRYYGTSTTQPTGIIFSNSGSPQTKDLTFTNGGWYDASGTVLSNPTLGITAPQSASRKPQAADSQSWFTLSGQHLDCKPSQPGIYIHEGKKVVINK